MQVEGFLHKYANTPPDERIEELKHPNGMTLDQIYVEVKELNDEIRTKKLKMKRLIEQAVQFWAQKEKKKNLQ